MQIVIRIADVADAEELTNLSVTTFRDAFEADNKKEDMDLYVAEELNLHKIRSTITAPENIFFMIYVEGIPAGYAKMRKVEHPVELVNYNHIEIERIYVHRDYQGKKIGAALMEHCLNYAKTNGHDCVWLGVWEHNTVAVNFYKRWGFEFFGSHVFRLGTDDQIDLLMKKMI